MTRFIFYPVVVVLLCSCLSIRTKNYKKEDCNCDDIQKAIKLAVEDYLNKELRTTESTPNLSYEERMKSTTTGLKPHYHILMTCLQKGPGAGMVTKEHIFEWLEEHEKMCN